MITLYKKCALRMILVAFTVFLITQSSVSIAEEGWLVQNAKIESMAIGNSNKDGFSIHTNGGDGLCNTVSFYEPIVTTARWKALLSVASIAMLSNKKVTVYSHADGADCEAATFIRVSK